MCSAFRPRDSSFSIEAAPFGNENVFAMLLPLVEHSTLVDMIFVEHSKSADLRKSTTPEFDCLFLYARSARRRHQRERFTCET